MTDNAHTLLREVLTLLSQTPQTEYEKFNLAEQISMALVELQRELKRACLH